MANWGFGNVSLNAPAAGDGAQAGPDIEQMDTPQLIFKDEAVHSGDRLKLFAQPWPADNLPRPGASLLAIASQKKLLAAAGPDGLILTGTAALRSQYIPRRRKKDERKGIPEDEPALKLYNPEVKLQVPRLSHVAFTSDESCLVIVAEQGGGLACYDVNALTNGGKDPAFQIGTMGQNVRQLLPNPNTGSDFTGFVGIVLESGQLLLADLTTKKLCMGANGNEVFHEKVQCASWSKLGKQIVAGLEDSTCVQIDFKGIVKDSIPQPPQLAKYKQTGDDGFYAANLAFPTSSISWLETHKFLIIYTPQANQPADSMPNHNSLYFIAQREKGKPFTFRQVQDDPCMTIMEPKRYPAVHHIQRLSEWGPSLQDMIILTSSATADVGTLASFKDQNGESNGEFILANLDERRKAFVCMSIDGSDDTTPVGMAMDFSAIECAPRPIPNESDMIEDSPFPLPALCVLNTDCVLQMWWTVYAHSVKQTTVFDPSVKQTKLVGPFPYPMMVNKDGDYLKYTHYQPDELDDATNVSANDSSIHAFGEKETANAIENKRLREKLLAAQSPFGAGVSKATMPFGGGAASRPTTANGMSSFGGAPAVSTPPAFGATAFGGTSQLGQKPSPWGGAPTPKPAFGQPTFGQSGQSPAPAASAFGTQAVKPLGSLFGAATQTSTSSFGAPAEPASSPFGAKPSQSPSLFGSLSGQNPTNATGTSSTFGKPSPVGGSFGSSTATTTAFGKPSPVGNSPATPTAPTTTFGKTSSIGGGTGFGQVGGMGAAKPSIWGSSGTNALKSGADSPFAPGKTGVQPTPFTGFANKTSAFGTAASPSASPFATAGNADGKNAFAAVGTSGQLGGFGKASAPTLSNENSMGSTATIGTTPFSSFGKFGSGSSGLSREATMGGEENASPPFKLVSGFKGDGSAKDDLPKPENPGAGMFGENFLSGTESKKPAAPSPFIKPEPGTEKQPSLKDIPQKQEVVPEDAPLPPDPSTNPSKYKMPDDMPLPPDFTTTKPKEEVDDDLPIAGSPPVNVTNSQTLSSGGPSDGPSDDDGSGFESEDEDDDGEEASDEEEDDSQEQFSEGASEDWAPANDETNDPEFSNNIKSYINHSTTPAKKLGKTSYTPAGLPKGPTFPPPQNRPTLSPRSPSPHRAVTAPIAQNSTFKPLPSQIKTTSIPPAKLVERPAAAPKEPRQPTAGELEDQAADRVKATLSQPPVPSKQLPTFYTHQDYAGTVDKPGVGGQIETVYRDVNSMIDVLGLNARSLEEFLEGHVQLRKPGSRVREDLEEDVVWCLGDVADIGRITNDIGMQLQEGQLEHVPALLADLGEQQKAILQLKAKTAEMRKHLVVRTDPEKLAMQAAAPLSAELQAQQAELRQGVQTIQGLLTDVENKLALLRADLAAARLQEGQKGPVPTVEAVTKTIIKMTAMVEQRSGDIDLLESQIKRLPNGIASLRLGDTYEDDLVSALGGSKLLTGSPSRSTPPRRRMAANGDPLGMSGMFGTSQSGGLRGSRFQTPPSSMRRSVAFTPEASAFGRSTGSLSGSTRKKMGDVTVEQVEAFQARKGRRRAVLGEFKRAVEKGGPRITATY